MQEDLCKKVLHSGTPTFSIVLRKRARMFNPKIGRRPVLLNSLTVCSILAIQSGANFCRIQIRYSMHRIDQQRGERRCVICSSDVTSVLVVLLWIMTFCKEPQMCAEGDIAAMLVSSTVV